MVAWFLGSEDVLSWLLVEGKRDDITFDINVIALLRQAIRSSHDTEQNVTEFDGEQPMQEDPDIFHASFMLIPT
ncbi:hypothetical protein Tco_1271624 [Tanacetum coccineum]